MLKLSLRERDRLVLVRQVLERELTVTRASEVAGLSRRQFHRILKRVRTEGDGGVIHGSRGRRSNGAKSEAMKERVLERAREPVFYDFGPTLLAEHIGRDPEIGEVNPYTLRLWMIEAGGCDIDGDANGGPRSGSWCRWTPRSTPGSSNATQARWSWWR